MSAVKYFFDVPVYRLAEEKYYSDQNEFIDSTLFPKDDSYSAKLRELERNDRNINIAIRDHLWRIYGGSWRFNEIVGYIRLHFLGSQIRGEYFGVKKKRIVRTRRKLLEYQTWKLAPEINIPGDSTSAEIFILIMDYVVDCKKELKGRELDTEILEFIGPYTDWRQLWLDNLRSK